MIERATWGTDDRRLRDMVARLQARTVLHVATATTLTAAQDIVLVDTTAGSVTVTLPDARAHAGKIYDIKKIPAANTLTVQASGSDTVDGGASSAWTTALESRRFESCIVTEPATWGWIVV